MRVVGKRDRERKRDKERETEQAIFCHMLFDTFTNSGNTWEGSIQMCENN